MRRRVLPLLLALALATAGCTLLNPEPDAKAQRSARDLLPPASALGDAWVLEEVLPHREGNGMEGVRSAEHGRYVLTSESKRLEISAFLFGNATAARATYDFIVKRFVERGSGDMKGPTYPEGMGEAAAAWTVHEDERVVSIVLIHHRDAVFMFHNVKPPSAEWRPTDHDVAQVLVAQHDAAAA